MSDAYTDMGRDNDRAELEEQIEKLLSSGGATHAELRRLAERCDSIPRGYFGSRTNWVAELERRLGPNFGR